MKLGILKTDDVRPEWVDEFGEYPDMFATLLRGVDPSLEISTYEVQQGQYPADIDEVDAYLMTGSKSSVYDDKEWIHHLAEFVRSLDKANKKLVGICFGHQMIAHALGGKTEKSDKGWGVARHTAKLTDKAGDYAQSGTPFSILVSHQDQVTEPAKGAEVLAASDFCPVAMCQLGDHMLSFQGHPEFMPAYSQQLLDLRRDIYGEDVYQQGVQSLSQPLDQAMVAGWIIDFLRD
ncbi:glutamine amidotransferase-related protein [Oceanicoccus sagamiensis]|uniref:GMP synthase n=1 Tax=Oceanicoccus sagamiensis TaxID=716816 RepID=A0A1X9NC53_9GAMM|nr:GMP synthase [Oceanicoccus sagamiensis]ARN74624.1 GMP synthase [Oceanicoccus sagamiensis]